jgi:hypothetical protein
MDDPDADLIITVYNIVILERAVHTVRLIT